MAAVAHISGTEFYTELVVGLILLVGGALAGWGISVVRGYLTLHKRVDLLVEDMAEVRDGMKTIRTEIEKQSPNGRDTNNTGDLIYRIAEKVGVTLPED